MKILAAALSIFILSVAFAPAVQILHSEFSSRKGKCCMKPVSEKEESGCDKKSCTVFSCCFKIPAFPPSPYKYHNVFLPELKVKHNFKPKKNYISFRSFDIWHPPRFV
jgi:hypothetical protein